ncbi:MAG TPA: hypothetical protein VGD56_11540, partial [Gemmatirosa sp.]
MRHSLTVRLALLAVVALGPGSYAAAQYSGPGRDHERIDHERIDHAQLDHARIDLDPGDEPAAVRDARAAQRSFEFTRRLRLPLYDSRSPEGWSYYGNGCPVRIGRLCWWDNDDDGAPPPEPSSISTARTRL